MKNWKDTVIKSESIKWKRVTPKTITDGKLDIDLHLPLTALFEAQAKNSFAYGMMTMMQFHTQSQRDNKLIEVGDIIKLFNDCGLPEIAKQFTPREHPNVAKA